MKKLLGLSILGLLLSGCTKQPISHSIQGLQVLCYDNNGNVVYDGESEGVVGIATRTKDHKAFLLFHTQSTEEKVLLTVDDKDCFVVR